MIPRVLHQRRTIARGNATTTYRIRVVPLEGNPWFLALDTARALDLKTNSGGVEHHLRKLGADEKRLVTPQQVRGIRNKAYAISESGLYKLIMRSDKPQARAFQEWATREVLPTIPQAPEAPARLAAPSFKAPTGRPWVRARWPRCRMWGGGLQVLYREGRLSLRGDALAPSTTPRRGWC